MKKKELAFKISIYTILVLLAVIFLFPIFMMISMSFFSEADVSVVPRKIFPSVFTPQNYSEAFQIAGRYMDDFGNEGAPYMLIYLKNSLIITVLFVGGIVVGSSLCAYAFSKIRFKGREPLFMVVLATMMIPSSITMIPLFTIYKFLGLLDNIAVLWLPIWFGGGAVNIFLLRQFMRGIPDEMLESAMLDGAGHFRRYLMIVIPNCVPILGYVALSGSMAVWNDFFTPLLYINSQKNWTLALGIANIIQTNDSGMQSKTHLLMAACTMMTLLPLTLFLAGQRLFIESITFTAVKG